MRTIELLRLVESWIERANDHAPEADPCASTDDPAGAAALGALPVLIPLRARLRSIVADGGEAVSAVVTVTLTVVRPQGPAGERVFESEATPESSK